jgi:TonB family protein
LIAPSQLSPAQGIELHEFPREITFQWSPVAGAETYALDVDCMDCCEKGKWCSDVDPKRVSTYRDLQTTRYSVAFKEDQQGRWRVSAVVGSAESEKSPWREFSLKTGGSTPSPKAPVQAFPAPNATLDSPSGPVRFEWVPVAGAESYTLEIDAYNSCAPDKWCSPVGRSVVLEGLKETATSQALLNTQRLRWRVWALVGGRQTMKSPWQVLGLNGPESAKPLTGVVEANEVLSYRGPVYAVRDDGITPPRPVFRAQWQLPEQARAEQLSGTVSVRAIITPDGSVSDVRVIKGLRDDVDQAALDAARQWRFEPATKDGQPVAVWTTIESTIRYQ